MKRADRIKVFCKEIWAWFKTHKRTLPWRDLSDRDLENKAYKVLVSEIMLQQTQVSRVTILYKNFIQIFPHISGLAAASNRDILMAWRGLGYNNRALRLRDAAKEIVKRGMFPREMEELQELPGIGHYTAGAIRNFAFRIPTACMDVNIRRILHRFFVGPENPDGTWKKDNAYLLRLAEEVLSVALASEEGASPSIHSTPSKHSLLTAHWHAALMDYGSLVCTKNSPKWNLLSSRMKSVCKAYGKEILRTKKMIKNEPGRLMAGRFVPNRIFRGKIVEALRNARTRLTLEQLGQVAIPDWPAGHSPSASADDDGRSMGEHSEWIQGLVEGLKRDRMIQEVRGRFALAK